MSIWKKARDHHYYIVQHLGVFIYHFVFRGNTKGEYNQEIIAHFFNYYVCTKRTLFVKYHSMWLDTASSKLKRMMGCKVLMDWKATCKEYVFEAVIMLLTAAAFCNDNSHSMVQKKEEAKIWTRNTSNASTCEME